MLDAGCFPLADGASTDVNGGEHFRGFLNFPQLDFLQTLPDLFTLDASKPWQFFKDFCHAHARILLDFVAGGKPPGMVNGQEKVSCLLTFWQGELSRISQG